MPYDTTRWTVSVSRRTDITVDSFLVRRGMKTCDLSKFFEQGVHWRVPDGTITEARSAFADMSPATLQSLIDEAVAAIREDPAGPAIPSRTPGHIAR